MSGARYCRYAALVLLSACASAVQPARHAAEPQTSHPTHALTVALEPAVPAHAGAAHELTLLLRIADGYHVMSNAPSEPQFIATRVSLAAMPDVSWQPARFPVAHMFRVSDREIATFVGEVSVTVPFVVASGAAPGPREISGSVAYQACTDASCLFPTTERFASRLEVAR